MRGYWSGHKVLDPTELEARFAVEDGLGFLDVTGNEALTDEGQEQLERVKKILPLLPPREADFVELYYFHKLKQTNFSTPASNPTRPTSYRKKLQSPKKLISHLGTKAFLLNLPCRTCPHILQSRLLIPALEPHLVVELHCFRE